MIPQAVIAWCTKEGLGKLRKQYAVSGGCISKTTVLQYEHGNLFLKQNSDVAEDMFAAEAAGLQALSHSSGPRIPTVHLFANDFILMEYLDAATQAADYWQRFGRELAQLHVNVQNNTFGFNCITYCGSTQQDNTACEDGHQFFAEQRLLHLGRLCFDSGLLNAALLKQLEALCNKLTGLIPVQPASIIHGDLWSGNAHTGPYGEPALIDPAVYFGWAEADLAMTSMFGSFPQEFYRSYLETNRLEDGWRERFQIYNLYHYLNHVYLFGGSYLGGVKSALNAYA